MQRLAAILSLSLLCPGLVLTAAPRFAGIFTDHAVLQRDRRVPVWGWADARQQIAVRFGDHEIAATTGADGRWRLELPPMPGEVAPRDLILTSGDSILQTVKDVVVGEVWVCSGQSNMEWPVAQSLDAEQVIAAATSNRIRLIKLPHQTGLVHRR